MKKGTMGCFNLVGKEDLEELLKMIKETVATHVKPEETDRSFGPVDMWNREKKHRTSLDMRRWQN